MNDEIVELTLSHAVKVKVCLKDILKIDFKNSRWDLNKCYKNGYRILINDADQIPSFSGLHIKDSYEELLKVFKIEVSEQDQQTLDNLQEAIENVKLSILQKGIKK